MVVLGDGLCVVCDEPVFKKRPNQRIPTYCTTTCRSKAQSQRRKAQKPPRPCLTCDAPCGEKVRYCSDTCREVGRHTVRTHGRGGYRRGCRCDICREAENTRMREYFRAVGGNKYRNPEVVRAWRAKVGPGRARYPETYRALDQLRRARKTTADAERFDPHEVFERDGWKCGICRRAVKRSLSYPHPRSASLDHVVPLSKGGAHTRANTQCAHLGCNMSKGNRGGNEQLSLLG